MGESWITNGTEFPVGPLDDGEAARLYEEWQTAIRRGRPDRFALHKQYLAATQCQAPGR